MPAKNKSWFKMQMENGNAEISILDEIGFFGITVKDFKAAFDQIRGAESIRLLVNSPGGDVFEGVALYNILSEVRAKLTVEVIGLAASAASIVALAGDKLIMGSGTYFMIHNPWGIAIGTAEDMEKMAETLNSMSGEFADIYAARSALKRDEVLAAMKDETWYTADEAVSAGFADEVKDYGEAAACVSLMDAKRLVIESRINQRLEMSKMKRETEKDLRDAGLSRSGAKSATMQMTSGLRDADAEGQRDAGAEKSQKEKLRNLKARAAKLKTTNTQRRIV